jgi:hypothetical protein
MGFFRKKTFKDKIKDKANKVLKVTGLKKKSPLEKGIEQAKEKAKEKASDLMQDFKDSGLMQNFIESALNATINVVKNTLSDYFARKATNSPKVEIPYNSTYIENKDEKKNL